jgi:hypothetical protein
MLKFYLPKEKRNMLRRSFLQMSTMAACAVAATSTASDAYSDDEVLAVTGQLHRKIAHHFTDGDLAALPQISFSTSTIWTTTNKTFSGPSLRSVLDAAGAGPGSLRLTAVNDYSVIMPRETVGPDFPIIANRIDGNLFGARHNGPLWVIFPYDENISYQNEEIYAFSIWQLTHIEILPD